MMKTQKAFRLRLYPTKSQTEQLKQFGGNCRWLWNHLLYLNQERYKTEKKFFFYTDMAKMLPSMKKETAWLGAAPACSLQRVARNLDGALKASFRGGKGFPRFKKKSNYRDSFYLTNQVFEIGNGVVHLPKMEPMRFRAGRLPEGRVLSATVSQDGDHFVMSVVCEIDISDQPVAPDFDTTVGIDLGLKELVVTSDGEVVANPRHLRKAAKRLRRLQRRLSKSRKGSANRKKRQLRLYRQHRKVRNQRADLIHKFTSSITKNYSVICAENLNIKGLMRNHKLAKAIADASWGEILRQLSYKSIWQGKHFVQIDRFDPSSQVCSCCGHRQKMPLDQRTYNCPSCGLQMDRDANAAMNIRNWGYSYLVGQGMPEPTEQSVNACGEATLALPKDTSAGIKSLAA
jgi:putative transposase